MILALERLRALRAGRQLREPGSLRDGGAVPIGIDDLPAEWRLEWEERAAIREYLGGQAREHAEAEALTEIIARMQAAAQKCPGAS